MLEFGTPVVAAIPPEVQVRGKKFSADGKTTVGFFAGITIADQAFVVADSEGTVTATKIATQQGNKIRTLHTDTRQELPRNTTGATSGTIATCHVAPPESRESTVFTLQGTGWPSEEEKPQPDGWPPSTQKPPHLADSNVAESGPPISEKERLHAAFAKEVDKHVSRRVLRPASAAEIRAHSKRAIPMKVLKIEKRDGSLKCRVVVLGFLAKSSTASDRYASVADISHVRALLHLWCQNPTWQVVSADAVSAFLSAPYPQFELVKLAPALANAFGFGYGVPRTCINGLPLCSAAYQAHRNATLRALGWQQLVTAQDVWHKSSGNGRDKTPAYLVTYVDDFLCFGRNAQAEMRAIAGKMELKFTTPSKSAEGGDFCLDFLGLKCHFWGSQTAMSLRPGGDGRSVFLEQYDYAEKIRDAYDLHDEHVRKIPLGKTVAEELFQEAAKTDGGAGSTSDEDFAKLRGSLQYLIGGTRPDLEYTLSYISRHSRAPGALAALKHLAAFAATDRRGLLYNGKPRGIVENIEEAPSTTQHTSRISAVKVFSDSDFGGLEGKSVSGTTVFMGGDLIWWKSARQTNVALSSCEAELNAFFEATKTALRFKHFCAEIFTLANLNEATTAEFYRSVYNGTTPTVATAPVSVATDSESALRIALSRASVSQRVRHMRVRNLFLSETIGKGEIKATRVSGVDNPADVCTKLLTRTARASACALLKVVGQHH
jgi:hypothetical protein